MRIHPFLVFRRFPPGDWRQTHHAAHQPSQSQGNLSVAVAQLLLLWLLLLLLLLLLSLL